MIEGGKLYSRAYDTDDFYFLHDDCLLLIIPQLTVHLRQRLQCPL